MSERGVVMVAYGAAAIAEAEQSMASLRQHHDWPIMVLTDSMDRLGDHTIRMDAPGWGARRAKLMADTLAPWPAFLYLDADTRVAADVSAGFEIVEDGWDLAITASQYQETGWLWQASDRERETTAGTVGRMLSLQGGMWFAARNERTAAFFKAWREEWAQFGHIDQAALVRALHREPVRAWMLGRPWNGGNLVEHRFGKAAA